MRILGGAAPEIYLSADIGRLTGGSDNGRLTVWPRDRMTMVRSTILSPIDYIWPWEKGIFDKSGKLSSAWSSDALLLTKWGDKSQSTHQSRKRQIIRSVKIHSPEGQGQQFIDHIVNNEILMDDRSVE